MPLHVLVPGSEGSHPVPLGIFDVALSIAGIQKIFLTPFLIKILFGFGDIGFNPFPS